MLPEPSDPRPETTSPKPVADATAPSPPAGKVDRGYAHDLSEAAYNRFLGLYYWSPSWNGGKPKGSM